MLKGFRDFIMRGNVIDLAVAVVIGSAFAAIVDTVVSSIITPVLNAAGSAEAGRLGFHIVRAHGFGLCNLNCTFETRSELLCHLKSFHAWSRGGRGDQDELEDAILDRYFLTQKRSTPRSNRLLGLEDGDVHPPRGMREDGEENVKRILCLDKDIQQESYCIQLLGRTSHQFLILPPRRLSLYLVRIHL